MSYSIEAFTSTFLFQHDVNWFNLMLHSTPNASLESGGNQKVPLISTALKIYPRSADSKSRKQKKY